MIMLWFEKLTAALYSNPAIALGAAFAWGILSILLSPCHLASIPLIVGFLDGQKDMNTKKAFKLSAFFTLGILLMMALIGLITSLLGRLMGDIGNWVEPVIGVIFLVMAFFIADIIKMPSFGGMHTTKSKGLWAALGMGFLLGIALGPCSFAFMAPILGIVFGAAGSQLLFALSLLLAYIIGHCLVIILAGTFAGVVQSYLHWTEKSKGTKIVRIICGILIFVAGLYLILKRYI
ncbi:MAG: cytochrome c biogenesis protein CcdA [Candidatus Cloacimonas sp.]|jgi:cytochrome c-type biogenesis protein|nr:cytochrome c biogenesis protein CcdA [Candidatus Cloacimonas sp.]